MYILSHSFYLFTNYGYLSGDFKITGKIVSYFVILLPSQYIYVYYRNIGGIVYSLL